MIWRFLLGRVFGFILLVAAAVAALVCYALGQYDRATFWLLVIIVDELIVRRRAS